MNLHRLRKLLGNEKAIMVSEGKVSLNGSYCWVDVWPFERLLGQTAIAWDKGKREKNFEKAVQLTEKVLAMKLGIFLPGESESWAVSIRKRLKDKFLRCVKKLGQYYEDREQREKAIYCYDKGLELDPCVEFFYQHLIVCYKHLGLRSEGVRAYERCCKNLTELLGVDPSDETKAIYQSLLK